MVSAILSAVPAMTSAAEVAEEDSSPPTPFRSSETPESASAMEAACSASEASPGSTCAS